jgi:hypothetical protein
MSRTTNTSTGKGGTLTIESGGTLRLTGAAPRIGMTTVVNNGTIEYALTGAQTFLAGTGGMTNFTNYNKLILSGSGAKTTVVSTAITVSDTFRIAGSPATFALGSSATLSYGASAVLEYAGTGAQTVGFTEWPSNGALSVPPTVVINNSSGVTVGLTSPQPRRLIGSSGGSNGTLVLKSGLLQNSSNVRIYSPSTIVRIGGSLSSLPDSLTSLTVNYQNTSPISTGPEFGVVNSTTLGGTVTLGTVSLTINNSSTVTLSANRQVNGSISLSNGTLDISTFTLTNRGSLNRTNGIITATNGTMNFTNTSSQTLQTAMFTSGTINNLTINAAGGVVIGSPIKVSNLLTLTNGALTTGDSLTLASTSTNTARVATLGTGTITGNVTVQRFLPARRAWRFLTAPVTQTTPLSLNATWQNQVDIVGPSGSNLSAIKNGYSFLTYNAATDAWTNVDNPASVNLTGTSLNNAFAAFIPGPSGTAFGNSADVTLSSTGALLTGNKSFTSTVASGNYILIPNPYASPVDLETIFTGSTGIDPLGTIYTWDPRLGGGSGTGGYISIQRTGVNTYNIAGGTTDQTQIIQSGQAFFIQANAASQSINFTEAAKSSTSINTVFGVGTGNTDKLRIGFNRYEGTNAVEISEVLSTFGSNYSKGVNLSEDAEKMWNNEENIALRRGNYNLSIESRPFIGATNDSIFLGLSSLRSNTNYALEFKPSNWDAGSKAYLIDKLLSTETLIDLNAASFTHQFTSTVATANDRFVVVFRGATLPNKNFIVGAEKLGTNKVKVNWEAQGEIGVKEYSLEKSVDGVNYQSINTQVAKNGNSNSKYTFTDNNPVNGVNYYRVKTTQQNDIERYSSVVTVNFKQNNATPLTVYPNPVRGNQIGLQLQEVEQGMYSIRLISVDGREVYKQQLQVGSSRGLNTTISPQAKLSTGTYTLQVVGKNQNYTQKVVVE